MGFGDILAILGVNVVTVVAAAWWLGARFASIDAKLVAAATIAQTAIGQASATREKVDEHGEKIAVLAVKVGQHDDFFKTLFERVDAEHQH